MRIDIGAKNKEAASSSVKVGDYAAFVTEYEELDGGRTAIGKAFDNRAGCAALIELLRAVNAALRPGSRLHRTGRSRLRRAKITCVQCPRRCRPGWNARPPSTCPRSKTEAPTWPWARGFRHVMDARTIQETRALWPTSWRRGFPGIPYQVRQLAGRHEYRGDPARRAGIPQPRWPCPPRRHTPTMMISLDDYDNIVRLADAALRTLTPTPFAATKRRFSENEDDMNDLIRSLVKLWPSGFEDGVRDLIRPLIEPHADEVTVDALAI